MIEMNEYYERIVGMDGWIRIWFYETIDQADSRTGEHFLEIQPIYEYHVNEGDEINNSMLMCIRKQDPNNPESMFWYAQVRLRFTQSSQYLGRPLRNVRVINLLNMHG